MFNFGRLSSPVCIACSQPMSSSAPESSPSSSPSSPTSQPPQARGSLCSKPQCQTPQAASGACGGLDQALVPGRSTTARCSVWEDVEAKRHAALRNRPRAVQREPCLSKQSHKNSLWFVEKPVVQNTLDSTFSSGLDLSGTFLHIAKKQASGSPQAFQRNNIIAK